MPRCKHTEELSVIEIIETTLVYKNGCTENYHNAVLNGYRVECASCGYKARFTDEHQFPKWLQALWPEMKEMDDQPY